MNYTYYPGCSAHASGRAYDESTRAVAPKLGITLTELPDWSCCGATAYMNVNEVLSFCLTARNLALAEKAENPVCTACSACFTNLAKTNAYLVKYPDLRAKVDAALAEGDLAYHGKVETKHLLDVVVRDVGLDTVLQQVTKPLAGLKVAPYYGCQMLRPISADPNPENPTMLEHLLEALGATPTDMTLKTWCCGGSAMATNTDVALRLCRNLLKSAVDSGAEVIAVTCPLCQTNLEAFQPRVNRMFGTSFHLPVLYFTQLMAMAFGLDATATALKRSIVPLTTWPKPAAQAQVQA
jgi:heterodisulfide reductase subunit B